MTNLITLTIPNDDHVALRAFGKALEEMALAHGAEPVQLQTYCNVTMTDEQNETLRERLKEVFGAPRDDIAEQAGIDPAIADAYVQGCHDTEARLVETDTTAQQVESLATNVVQREVNLPEPTVSDATTDSTGTPWDERIHSASKALNADGTWRLRRKPKDMDEAEWAEYVAEVKGVIQNDDQSTREHDEQVLESEYPSSVYAPEPPVTPPGDDFHTDAGAVTEQTVAGIPPIPVPPPVVVPREVSTETLSKAVAVPYGEPEQTWDFPKLMKFLTERHGKIDVPTVNQLLAVDGLVALTDLNAHPDKIGPFVARVKAHLGE